MRHPTRAITHGLRTRRAKRPGKGDEEVSTLGWPETTLRVWDVMNRQPVIAKCGITVGDAWRLMRARKIRHVPVRDHKRRLAGIVTDRDLRQAVLEPWAEERVGDAANVLAGTPVERVMSWGVVTVAPEAEIRQAAHVARGLRHLVKQELCHGRPVELSDRGASIAFVAWIFGMGAKGE